MIRLVSPRRARAENIVPMINVAFLLLIFFLMTAVIAPPDPVVVTPPNADGAQATDDVATVYVEANGTIWIDGQRDGPFAQVTGKDVSLRADKALDARVLAGILQDVQRAGAHDVTLVVARP